MENKRYYYRFSFKLYNSFPSVSYDCKSFGVPVDVIRNFAVVLLIILDLVWFFQLFGKRYKYLLSDIGEYNQHKLKVMDLVEVL